MEKPRKASAVLLHKQNPPEDDTGGLHHNRWSGIISCLFCSGRAVNDNEDGDYTKPHIIYLVIFTLGIFGSLAVLFPRTVKSLNVAMWCSKEASPGSCQMMTSYILVYRVQFALSTFFFIILVVQLSVSFSRKNLRVAIHKGCWIPKTGLLVLLLFTASVIPKSFSVVWTYAGSIGAFVSILFQLFFIIDASRSWNRFLLLKLEKSGSMIWPVLLWTSVGAMYLSTGMVVILIYLVYSNVDYCGTNTIFITVNTVFSILAFLLVVATRIHQREILTASIVTLYTTFLTYSAIVYGQTECDPDRTYLYVSYLKHGLDFHVLEEVILIYLLIVYACSRRPDYIHFKFGRWNVSRGAKVANEEEQSHLGNNGSQTARDDQGSICNPPLVYLLLFLASLHTMMAFTHWLNPAEEERAVNFTTNWFALCLKTLSSTLVVVLYLWTLIAPIVFPNRDMSSLTTLMSSLCQFLWKMLHSIFIQPWSPCKRSYSTRFVYTFLLLTGTAAACVMYIPSVRRLLETSPHFCSRLTHMGNCFSTDPAYLAVYRICFSMAAFFLLFAVVLFSVRSRRDPRDLIQNGLWIVKFGLFFGLLVCTFFFPLEFGRIWLYFGLMGTFFFAVIQLCLLVDFARLWNRKWAQKMENTGKKCYFYVIIACTAFLYALSLVAIVCFFVFFSVSKECQTNKLFLSINFVMCAVATVISIHPKGDNDGLLQSAIVTTYTMFLTWSALSYNPNERCNPLATYVSAADMRPSLNILAFLELLLMVVTVVYFNVRIAPLSEALQNLITISSNLFKSILRQDRGHEQMEVEEKLLQQGEPDKCETISQNEESDTEELVQYSYSLFHLVHFITSLHITMILTNWFSPQDGSTIKLSINWAAMCIKFTSSSLCILLYVWSLAVHILMK